MSRNGIAQFRTRLGESVRTLFFEEAPDFLLALVPFVMVSIALYTRNPFRTNFIFDEQEALLANPYVRAVADPSSHILWRDAFTRDFWGLTPERTIGSYRPIPNLVWRALWFFGAREGRVFAHHYVNVLLHGANAALVTLIAFRVTKIRSLAWLSGLTFVASAITTECVCGVVGLADILGGLGALLALYALTFPLRAMPFVIFLAVTLGLFSKESALCLVPLVPLGALLLSRTLHPEHPRPVVRAAFALASTALAFVLYVELRRRLFPVTVRADLTAEANAAKPWMARSFAAILRWFAQPGLPADPLNNPFLEADVPHRVAGALRVFFRGFGQVVFPRTLSGDYSAPQEPVPEALVFPESILGGLLLLSPVLFLLALGVMRWIAPRKLPAHSSLMLFCLLWVVLSFFPVSNIPVVLPTCRAERFWYFPVIGSALLFPVLVRAIFHACKGKGGKRAVVFASIGFIVFQGFAARRHANDYADDLQFWDAARKASPRSAKAHLNYSVMLGARGDLPGRLLSNQVALDLAPKWPMGSVYMADTLCRMDRTAEAVVHYRRGFSLGPGDPNLIALGLQCLWDKGFLSEGSETLDDLTLLAQEHPGSWLRFLVDDIRANGKTHGGVDPKYRPRGYDQGPKKEE